MSNGLELTGANNQDRHYPLIALSGSLATKGHHNTNLLESGNFSNMANRAYLVAHNHDKSISYDELNEDGIIGAANYLIPIFWLAMFDLDDIVWNTIDMEDEEGTVTRVQYPLLLASATDGRQRFSERMHRILFVLPNELKGHFDDWVVTLEQLTSPFVQVETCEIWMMEPEVFEQNLKSWLKAFQDNEQQSWSVLLNQAGMELDIISGRVRIDISTAQHGLQGFKLK